MGTFISVQWAILIVILIMFYTISSRARFHIKMTIYGLGIAIAVLIPMPLTFFRIGDYRNALFPGFLILQLARCLGVSLELRGLENVNKKRGAVILSNHQSVLDLATLCLIWPHIGRATNVVKREVMYLQPFGLAAWLCGTLFIDRRNRGTALNAINKESRAINDQQAKLIFYPEGTRNQSGRLLPFKKGPFVVAIDCQCPLQPIVISRYHFLDSGEHKRFDRGHCVVHILPEIPTKGLDKGDLQTLLDDTYKIMDDEFALLSAETKIRLN